VHDPGLQFDEDEHVEPAEEHRIRADEVTGGDPDGLCPQERAPGLSGAARRRWHARALQ
jgi:hypothetical protein